MSLNVVMAPSVAPIGSKLTINENGEYNVTDYAVADVNVSGGGGSSDFSTAEVTITNNTNINPLITIPSTNEYEGMKYCAGGFYPPMDNTPYTINAIIYGERTYIDLSPFSSYDIITSGDIVHEDDSYYITGDCSITFGQNN